MKRASVCGKISDGQIGGNSPVCEAPVMALALLRTEAIMGDCAGLVCLGACKSCAAGPGMRKSKPGFSAGGFADRRGTAQHEKRPRTATRSKMTTTLPCSFMPETY